MAASRTTIIDSLLSLKESGGSDYIGRLKPEEISYFTTAEPMLGHPSVLHYFLSEEKLHPIAFNIMSHLKKLDAMESKNERQPNASPQQKPLDALVTLQEKNSEANLIHLAAEIKDAKYLGMVLDLISDTTCDQAAIQVDKQFKTALYSVADNNHIQHLSTLQKRLSPESYISATLKRDAEDFTLTQKIAFTCDAQVWQTHLENLPPDILSKEHTRINKKGGSALSILAEFLGTELKTYQNSLPKKILNDLAKQYIVHSTGRWHPLSIAARSNSHAIFISFLEKLSPFTIKATANTAPSVIDVIDKNSVMTDAQKKDAKEKYSYLVNFESYCTLEQLVQLASLHIKNKEIIDEKEWIATLKQGLELSSNEPKIKNQLHALLGRIYLSLYASDRDQKTMTQAYQEFLLIDDPKDLDAEDNLIVSQTLNKDLSDFSNVPSYVASSLTSAGKDIFAASLQGLKHFDATLEKKDKDHKHSFAMFSIRTSPPPEEEHEKLILHRRAEEELQIKSDKLKALGWQKIKSDMVVLEAKKQDDSTIAALAKYEHQFEIAVDDPKAQQKIIDQMQRELFTKKQRHSIFPVKEFKQLNADLTEVSKKLGAESKAGRALESNHANTDKAEEIITNVRTTLANMINDPNNHLNTYVRTAKPFWASSITRKNILTILKRDMQECYDVINHPDRSIDDKIEAIDKLRNQRNYYLDDYKAVAKQGSHLGVALDQLDGLKGHTSKLITAVRNIKSSSI